MRVDLDGSVGNKGHVFIFDDQGRLRFKMWFYGDGIVTWREFDETGKQTHEPGEQFFRRVPGES